MNAMKKRLNEAAYLESQADRLERFVAADSFRSTRYSGTGNHASRSPR